MENIRIRRIDEGAMAEYVNTLGSQMKIYKFDRKRREGLEMAVTDISNVLLNQGLMANTYEAKVGRRKEQQSQI